MASYLGNNASFEKALAKFAESYADQNERDYEAFAAACKSGRLHARRGDVGHNTGGMSHEDGAYCRVAVSYPCCGDVRC